jgi:hypothetical protein
MHIRNVNLSPLGSRAAVNSRGFYSVSNKVADKLGCFIKGLGGLFPQLTRLLLSRAQKGSKRDGKIDNLFYSVL